ncbi:hypothetical protein BAE44_0016935 [Dichanthelium oligosanthes]|uniref:Uncharacterized protein n=1 Tax=Dichanthelium oligosanthes TaxID=888268 RepID=A0A1E5VA69_9POAL|nr:hypothetical protein BAE44_0016935 [Dichanthelium oligosanthes]
MVALPPAHDAVFVDQTPAIGTGREVRIEMRVVRRRGGARRRGTEAEAGHGVARRRGGAQRAEGRREGGRRGKRGGARFEGGRGGISVFTQF